jgi:uncharacterized membrane protein YdbT with pleckstrin-like domain
MGLKLPSDFTLVEGEVLYWYGRLSWRANWLLILLGVVTIWIFGLGFLFFLLAYLRIKATEYLITSRRIYAKYGLVARRVFEVKLDWVTGVMARQGFIGRLCNYGDVIFSVPGHYAGSVLFVGVHDPMHLREIVEDIRRRQKEAQKIEEKLRELEKEYEFGRIPEERYQKLRRKYLEELRKYLGMRHS